MTRVEEIQQSMMLQALSHQEQMQRLQLEEQQLKVKRALVELETVEWMKKKLMESFKGDAMPKAPMGGMS